MGTFTKYSNGPVFGNEETGTVFDGYVWKDNGKYRMDFSWRPKKACAVTFSDDGINWSDPIITLEYDESTGWEDNLNRNCVIKVDGKYKMWYTGQAREHSYIGYAESDDGLTFKRILNEPVMISEYPWEGESVMNPCVMFENGKYRMYVINHLNNYKNYEVMCKKTIKAVDCSGKFPVMPPRFVFPPDPNETKFDGAAAENMKIGMKYDGIPYGFLAKLPPLGISVFDVTLEENNI